MVRLNPNPHADLAEIQQSRVKMIPDTYFEGLKPKNITTSKPAAQMAIMVIPKVSRFIDRRDGI